MTDIIISFDTEDITSSRAADAIRDEADLLQRLGIRGCFCIVGLLAKHLKEWGREDVISSLSSHEINFHTYAHSVHPTIDEYTDIADFKAAKEEVIRQETVGVQYVKDVFGVDRVFSACPPGNSNTYVAMYAYEEMGIPIYAGTYCDTMQGDGVFYCNTYHLRYTYPIEKLCLNYTKEAEDELIESFAKCKRVIFYTHPNIAIMSRFWDRVNYAGRNINEFGKWEYPPERDPEVIADFFKNMERVLRRIKEDGRFRFTTYGEIAGELEARPERVIKRSDIPNILSSLKKELYPIGEFSLYDLFMAAKAFAEGESEYICRRSYGLLDDPYELKRTIKLKSEEILSAVKRLKYGEFLPEKFAIGDTLSGPADILIAAYEALSGACEIVIEPKPQLPSLDALPEVKKCSLKGTWLHSDEFEDKFLSRRLRLQSYTMRFNHKETK